MKHDADDRLIHQCPKRAKALEHAAMPSQVLSQPLTQLEAQGYVAYHQGVLVKNNPYHRDEQPEFWLQWFRGWHLGFDTRTMILGHQFHSAQQQPATL